MSVGEVDIVVPAYGAAALTQDCVESILTCSGKRLGRVIVVHDPGPADEALDVLRALRDREPRVRLLENDTNLGFVRSANRGLSLRSGHAVVLNNDARVTEGWLDELIGVLDEEPRIAAVSPLSNNATLCSIPRYQGASAAADVHPELLDFSRLPRWTAMPTLVGFCMLMRAEALDLLGGFDPVFGRGYNEENDWCQRAQRHGFIVVRSNRAFVFHQGSTAFGESRKALDLHNARRLVARYPTYLEQNRSFDNGPQAQVAARWANGATNPIRVDLLGARSTALAESLRARGTVLIEGDEQPDVVHLLDPAAAATRLPSIFGGGARVVLSAPELSELANPSIEPQWSLVQRRRARIWALVQASDAVLVESEPARADVLRWFGLLPERVHVVPPALRGPNPVLRQAGLLATWAGGDSNVDLVIAAFGLLRDAGEATELAIFVEGRARAPSAPLPAGVRVVSVTEPERAGAIARAVCLVGSTNSLNTPAPILEAAEAGVPVAAWLGPAARLPVGLVLAAGTGEPISALASAVRSATRPRVGEQPMSEWVGPTALARRAEQLESIYRAVLSQPSRQVLEVRENLSVLVSEAGQ